MQRILWLVLIMTVAPVGCGAGKPESAEGGRWRKTADGCPAG